MSSPRGIVFIGKKKIRPSFLSSPPRVCIHKRERSPLRGGLSADYGRAGQYMEPVPKCLLKKLYNYCCEGCVATTKQLCNLWSSGGKALVDICCCLTAQCGKCQAVPVEQSHTHLMLSRRAVASRPSSRSPRRDTSRCAASILGARPVVSILGSAFCNPYSVQCQPACDCNSRDYNRNMNMPACNLRLTMPHRTDNGMPVR